MEVIAGVFAGVFQSPQGGKTASLGGTWSQLQIVSPTPPLWPTGLLSALPQTIIGCGRQGLHNRTEQSTALHWDDFWTVPKLLNRPKVKQLKVDWVCFLSVKKWAFFQSLLSGAHGEARYFSANYVSAFLFRPIAFGETSFPSWFIWLNHCQSNSGAGGELKFRQQFGVLFLMSEII